VLIGSVIRTVPPVQAGAVAGAGIVVVACGQLARPEPAGITAVTALGGALWAAGVVAGLALRRLDGRARDTAEAIRRTERLDLARELHDVVAHHITGMLIQAQAAQVLARRDPAKVAGSLGDIEAAGSDALAAMRRVVGLLRDDAAAPPSTDQEDLAELVERFGRQGPEVRLRVPGDEAAWPPEVTSTVYRIVQEALTNVLRHAPRARSVAVTVGRDPHGFTVEVADDAPPVSARAQHRGGYGLIGMRERVVALGGTLGAGPRPGSGWSVRATLPVPPGEPR
jgi:signal transduction histidine kinase